MENKVKEIEKLMRVLSEKVDNLENRSSRENLRIVGLKEGFEGSQPTTFFASWLKVLELDTVKATSKLTVHTEAAYCRTVDGQKIFIQQDFSSAVKEKH